MPFNPPTWKKDRGSKRYGLQVDEPEKDSSFTRSGPVSSRRVTMNITPTHFPNVNNVWDEGLTGLSWGAPDPDENPDDSEDSDDSDNSCGDYCRWPGKDQANDEPKKNNARTATDDRKSSKPHARKISMA